MLLGKTLDARCPELGHCTQDADSNGNSVPSCLRPLTSTSRQSWNLRPSFLATEILRNAVACSADDIKSCTKDTLDAEARPVFLNKAIFSFERAMMLDANDYLPPSNLPRLYRERRWEGDEKRAVTAASIALVACERSRKRNPADPMVADIYLAPRLTRAIFCAPRSCWGRCVRRPLQLSMGCRQVFRICADHCRFSMMSGPAQRWLQYSVACSGSGPERNSPCPGGQTNRRRRRGGA